MLRNPNKHRQETAMTIREEKWQKLQLWMKKLGLNDTDIQEKFITGSGSGGQKINKTASCVYLKHEPSGIEVKCQQERSRELNRYQARVRLCEKYASIQLIFKPKNNKRLKNAGDKKTSLSTLKTKNT